MATQNLPYNVEFQGQQEDEKIFYVIRPHFFKRVVIWFRAFVVGFLCIGLSYMLSDRLPYDPNFSFVAGIIISLMVFLGLIWWGEFVYESAKGIITDRRFVRIEAKFPIFRSKRSLFWNEVAKVKAYAPNLLFRFLKIGSLEVEPTIAPLEDVRVTYDFYFEDLGNYIDKILFARKNRPEDLNDMRPFVPKPAGKRY